MSPLEERISLLTGAIIPALLLNRHIWNIWVAMDL